MQANVMAKTQGDRCNPKWTIHSSVFATISAVTTQNLQLPALLSQVPIFLLVVKYMQLQRIQTSRKLATIARH